jgi:hypothetical protein
VPETPGFSKAPGYQGFQKCTRAVYFGILQLAFPMATVKAQFSKMAKGFTKFVKLIDGEYGIEYNKCAAARGTYTANHRVAWES